MIKKAPQPNGLIKYLRGHKRAISEGVSMPWKQPIKSGMTVLTLAICFFIPLFLWTIWLNYDELKESWQQQGSIAVFLEGKMDLKEAGIFMQEIKEMPIVETVVLTDSNQVKKTLFEDAQFSQVIDLIQAEDFPKQISVKIKPDSAVEEVDDFVNNLSINPQVEYVSYDKQWLTQLEAITQTLLQMARISALMFLLIVMVILGNTIANEITDHKSELRLLELIGASDAQTRRSFLYMGVVLGIIAALLSMIFLSVSFYWLEDTVASLVQNFGINITLHGLSVMQIFSVLFAAILVTWLAARLSLSSAQLNQI
jgi:cell division transport system permease protein